MLHRLANRAGIRVNGEPIAYTSHDFRRVFATDALASGLPPHIVQVLLGHKSIDTTQVYAAVYPQDVIRHHRTWIGQRRLTRPSEEYRQPTLAEWEEFEGHFVKRKVSLGSCGRTYGTNWHHEHACLRCALLRLDPAQADRLRDIITNLTERVAEAEQNNWLGEVEGLKISLAGEDKLAQMELQVVLNQTVELGFLQTRPLTARSPVRTLATQQQWPPSHLDELLTLLVAVPYPHTQPSRPQDTEYGLLTAIAELEAWLEAGPNDRQPAGDRHSFAVDVAKALSRLGPAVSSRIPAAGALVAALQTVASDGPRADREPVSKSLDGLRAGLSDPGTSVAALEDLLDAERDPFSSHLLVTNMLAVFTEVLEISDRAGAEICRILGGILDDQALEISIACHSLDGTPRAKVDQPDEFAGLAEEDRLELSRRFLLRPAQEGHHVVWVGYDDARVDVDGSWRQRVGMVEFFDGLTLIETLNNPGPALTNPPLPEELLTPIGPGGRDIDLWPSAQQHPHWVAARVDLGTDTFSNPIQVARAQADAVVELAAFESGKSIWSPLAGVLHLVDGVHHSSERFNTPDEIQRRISVDNDSTAAEFPEIASSIAEHLPIVNPALRRLLHEISALNATTRSHGLDLLTREVTVVETVTRMNGQPPTDWSKFLENHMPIFQARNQVTREIYDAVSEVLNAFYFKDAPHLNSRAIQEPLPGGRALFKWKAAFDLVPQLVAELPDHHMAARRLREVARRTQDVTQLRGWVDDLAAESRTKMRRAARLRNGLSHAGAAPAGVTATVRLLINHYARLVAGAALKAVADSRPVKRAFDDYRTGNKRWRQRIPAAADVSAALFDPPEQEA